MIRLAVFVVGTIAVLTPQSASRAATDNAPVSIREAAIDTIRPGTYVFCRPYSAAALTKSMNSLRDPAFKTFDAVPTEAGVLQTLRKYGGALVRFRAWREVALRYDDNMWSMRNSVSGFIYRDDGYLYRNRTLDAIAVTDKFYPAMNTPFYPRLAFGVTDERIPAYNNSFYPRLAFIHEPKAKKGFRKGPQWSEVSTFVTTPICKRG